MYNRVSLFVYASVRVRRKDKGKRAYVRGAKVYAAWLDELKLVLEVRGKGEGFVCKCAMSERRCAMKWFSSASVGAQGVVRDASPVVRSWEQSEIREKGTWFLPKCAKSGYV